MFGRAMYAIAASVSVSVSAVAAQSVSYDYDKGTDFTKLKTYAWVPGQPARDELSHKRIVEAVDSQLTAKGFTKAEGGNADVLVTYRTTFDRELQISGFATGWAGSRFSASRSGSARAAEVTIGQLTVDLLDGKSRSVVWRGTAQEELDGRASPEKKDKHITKAAEKMFKNYPYKK